MMSQSILYESLRQKRNELARQANIKPFMVLHNKVLQEIAEKQPTILEELAKIKGIGPKKIAKYGKFILETINSLSSTAIPKVSEEKVFSVGGFIDFLNQILVPQRAVIQGEVGEVKPRNNYTFFKLLDKKEEAVLSCFVWNDRLARVGIELKEGLELKVEGYPKLVKTKGYFSFEVEHIGLVGEGALKLAFEALKKKLSAAGFFAPERKKKIPSFVEKVGLITSTFADAKTDFLTHLGRFGFKIFFYDVHVEGLYSTDDIVSAIRWFNENMLDVEILVLTRGGGSLESFQAFNSEAVAKAIFSSRIPVVTGIGHENDETITDLVADVYGSTPTHAARILSDPWRNIDTLITNVYRNIVSIFSTNCLGLQKRLLDTEENLITLLARLLKFKNQGIDNLQTFLYSQFQRLLYRVKQTQVEFLNNWGRIKNILSSLRNKISVQEKSLTNESLYWIKLIRKSLFEFEQKLRLSDPSVRLKQGYSIVYNASGKIIKRSTDLSLGEYVKAKFSQGSATSCVEKIQK